MDIDIDIEPDTKYNFIRNTASARSTCSSLFEKGPETLSMISTDSMHGIGSKNPGLYHLSNLKMINEENTEKTYSQYEPVNNILQKLFVDKMTHNKLNSNDGTDNHNDNNTSTKNECDKSYFEYWSMTDEHVQILQMLEPVIIQDQSTLFETCRLVCNISNDLNHIINNEIPLIETNIDPNLISSFNSLSTFFQTLQRNVKYLLFKDIVCNSYPIHSLVNNCFIEMYGKRNSFIKGINIPFDFDITETPILLKYYKRIHSFETLLPFSALSTSKSSIEEAHRFAQRIQQAIHDNARQRSRYQLISQFINHSIEICCHLPEHVFELLIILPFVCLCCIIFSLTKGRNNTVLSEEAQL